MSREAADKLYRVDSAEPHRPRSLRILHEGLARNFAAALSDLLRCRVEGNLAGIERRGYGDFLDDLDSPSGFHVLKARPLEERLFLDLELSILFPMIDRLLGGGRSSGARLSGRAAAKLLANPNDPTSGRAPTPRRPLSEIEQRLAARIVRLFSQEFETVWKPVEALNVELLQYDANPRALRVLPADENLMVLAFELTVEQDRGTMRLGLPCRFLDRLAGGSTEKEQAPPSETAVVLAETRISARELADLRVGDVIVTETEAGSPAIVLIDRNARFQAKPGAYQGRRAACLLDPVESASSDPDLSPDETSSTDNPDS